MADKKMGFWDVIAAIATVVTPILVWYYGTRVGEQVKERQGDEVARVSRAALMQTLIPSLSDPLPLKKETAFEALLYAFPPSSTEDITPLLSQVKELEQDVKVRMYYCNRLFEVHVIRTGSGKNECASQEVQQPSPATSIQTTQEASVSSGPKPSGLSNAFSAPYELCTDKIPDGMKILKQQFTLSGDRTCGSWSTCTLTTDTPARVCWQFTLQGHDEWFPPRPAFSSGMLKYTYGR
jgi:hypothetical protein